MKKSRAALLTTLTSALLFTLLFYDKSWGLNFLIFQSTVLVSVWFTGNRPTTRLQKVLYAGTAVSAIFAFFYHAPLAMAVSWISLFTFSVSLATEEVRSFHHAFLSVVPSLARGIKQFWQTLFDFGARYGIPVNRLKRGTLYILPVIVIVVFFQLYSASNPSFNAMTASFGVYAERVMDWIWEYVNVVWFVMLFFGLLVSILIYFPSVSSKFLNIDRSDNGFLKRTKSKLSFKPTGLKQELKIGIFLLTTLNLMLLTLLFFEAQDVWFSFEWNGQFLKGFVHEGIYLLILSILISMGVALYFFRGNQNFYSRSKPLKLLTHTWIGLNGLLVLSIAIRDFWYIQHFALAYKRIGVLFFLVACLIGLATIFIKIMHKRNNTYLFRVNSLAVYGLFIVSCFFNWDVLIAKYNFNHADRAFLHLDYMARLDDKALPYLEHAEEKLQHQQELQQHRVELDSAQYSRQYLNAAEYVKQVKQREQRFVERWESLHWLEWNPAEATAFEKLKKS